MQLLTFAIFIPTLALIMWNNLDNPLQVIDTLKKGTAVSKTVAW